MEISRWRKPPVRYDRTNEPRRGHGRTCDVLLSPCWGSLLILLVQIRWLAPPANFRRPSGSRQKRR